MTYLLARRDGEWFLAAFAKHLNGCNLSTPHEPISQREKFHLWRGQTYVQSHAPVNGVTFYPNIYYHGLRVWLEGWVPNTPDPVFYCRIVPEIEDVERSPYYSGPSLAQVNQAKDRNRDEWARLLAQREKGYEDLFQRLVEDGWARPGIDEFTRMVHIDELDKIEGPPPESLS